MSESRHEPVARFCGNCNCGCPQVFVDPDASEERRIRITDDFGQQIQLSADQFQDLLDQAKTGSLDRVTTMAG
ncbi:hypothetical protein ACIG5E_16850 [Kitasatospora sp. NPDC053057]|uniref:hypothetical protein n=1 Tax=Kitasatospora sp. NPDC053057 TaxID=3364062 RepID=UPI0037C8FBF0